MNVEAVEEISLCAVQEVENKHTSVDHLRGKDINGFQCWDNNYPYPVSNFKDNLDCDDGWESSDSQPQGERWPPLGAPNDEDNLSFTSEIEYKGYIPKGESPSSEKERLRELEEEQEQLNNSLLALTSHFAQVQFRLKQIVDASPTEKETLLVELEEFANRGIPDLRPNVIKSPIPKKGDPETRLDLGHERQKELIGQLKQQLEDLENYAYQTGEAGLPQSIVLQKQRVIIDQLKGKLNLNVDDFDKLTIEDIKSEVDKAVKEMVLKTRSHSKAFLQPTANARGMSNQKQLEPERGGFPVRREGRTASERRKMNSDDEITIPQYTIPGQTSDHVALVTRSSSSTVMKRDTESLIHRASTVLSMLTLAQFGCGSSSIRFEKNSLKKTSTGYHWGDLRAELELAIASVVDAAETALLEDAACESEVEASSSSVVSGEAITLVVRKRLCPALRDLIQHGLMPVGQSQSLVPFMSCLPHRSEPNHQLLHAWDFILKYYYLKKGDQYNRTPARKLSQSFNLEITGGSPITNKQMLLQTIGSILSSHGPLKRSYDSHFKAFVSASLNKKKLITWLRLIFRTQTLVESYYQSWSYVSKTGFEDAFRSMDQFSKYNFSLPVDLAVKPFQNIRDVFS